MFKVSTSKALTARFNDWIHHPPCRQRSRQRMTAWSPTVLFFSPLGRRRPKDRRRFNRSRAKTGRYSTEQDLRPIKNFKKRLDVLGDRRTTQPRRCVSSVAQGNTGG